MIKALFASIGMVLLFGGVYFFGVYDFFASKTFFWGAFVGLIIMFLIAAFVLGVPFSKEETNGTDKD